jgi:hypothetical protein
LQGFSLLGLAAPKFTFSERFSGASAKNKSKLLFPSFASQNVGAK